MFTTKQAVLWTFCIQDRCEILFCRRIRSFHDLSTGFMQLTQTLMNLFLKAAVMELFTSSNIDFGHVVGRNCHIIDISCFVCSPNWINICPQTGVLRLPKHNNAVKTLSFDCMPVMVSCWCKQFLNIDANLVCLGGWDRIRSWWRIRCKSKFPICLMW